LDLNVLETIVLTTEQDYNTYPENALVVRRTHLYVYDGKQFSKKNLFGRRGPGKILIFSNENNYIILRLSFWYRICGYPFLKSSVARFTLFSFFVLPVDVAHIRFDDN